jgi:CheY-like chemotaxis protein
VPEDETVPTGSETVLVVEDEAAVRAVAVEMITDLGYAALEAANPDDAAEILRKQRIELLFSDVVMPGVLTSTQLAELARQLQPGIKVLFTSGYAENAIVHHGRLDAGVDLISKPYKRDQLARRFRQILDADGDRPASSGHDKAAPVGGGFVAASKDERL